MFAPARFSARFSVWLAAACLAGCATSNVTDYPSLAIRDVERASGTLAPPRAPAPPPEIAPATLTAVADLRQRASEAHARFLAAVPPARRAVDAASGTAPGGETWAVAQVALAELEAMRSQAVVALADLDRLYVDAAVADGVPADLAAAHEEVGALVGEENALVDSLQAALR